MKDASVVVQKPFYRSYVKSSHVYEQVVIVTHTDMSLLTIDQQVTETVTIF